MCYECYKKFLDIDFSIKDSCPVYLGTYRPLGKSTCPHLFEIRADINKAISGDKNLGSGVNIARMLAERGDIEVPDMGIFNLSLEEMGSS